MHILEMIPIILDKCSQHNIHPNRTQLQKIAYFVLCRTGSAQIHRPHYYGPYSSEVAEAVQDLVSLDMIHETHDVFLSDGSNTEVRRYSYSLTKLGEELAHEFSEEYSNESRQASDTVDRLVGAGVATEQLSFAAKVHFILQRNPKAAVRDIVELADDVGWSLSENSVTDALDYLDRSGLRE